MVINLRALGNALRRGLRLVRQGGRSAPAATPPGHVPRVPLPAAPGGHAYPGDFRGRGTVRYAPHPDGEPDPGEVVWTWVPYQEDHGRGKDRPVLLVGDSGSYLLAVMLTSRDRVPSASASGDYVDLGVGRWDRQGRPSEARLDRILQIRPQDIRREGAVLDRKVFERVAAGLRGRHGWT